MEEIWEQQHCQTEQTEYVVHLQNESIPVFYHSCATLHPKLSLHVLLNKDQKNKFNRTIGYWHYGHEVSFIYKFVNHRWSHNWARLLSLYAVSKPLRGFGMGLRSSSLHDWGDTQKHLVAAGSIWFPVSTQRISTMPVFSKQGSNCVTQWKIYWKIFGNPMNPAAAKRVDRNASPAWP